MDSLLNDQFTISGINADGVPFLLDCGVYAVHYESGAKWAFPVGESQYIPERWYAAVVHSLDGSLNDNNYKHSGLDLNLDLSPYGDVERSLGLSVYAVADGIVTYITDLWSGVPMLVIRVEHDGEPLWVRYAHIVPCVMLGEAVKAGQSLGGFANWKTGDHLHHDMCLDEIERDWLTPKRWVDPVEILSEHLPPERVAAMVRKGT